MDATLGGDWWQEVYLAHDGPVGRLEAVVRGYRERLSTATGGWGGWTVPVTDKIGARPEYLLMQFTQHPDGHWAFHEALSLATREWREAARMANPDAKEQLEATGQRTLEGLEQPPAFEDDEDAWIDEIEANLTALVRAGRSVVVQNEISEVFGRAVGLAREKHLRTALRRLHAAGLLRDDPKGQRLQRYSVVPVMPPASTS